MKRLTISSRCARRERGMTLIEILVAIVVLSIGLLGLAGLQLKGVQVNQGSIYRWQAAMLAEDIADRMRADRADALAGGYTLSNFVNSAPAGSTPNALALNEWLARVTTLPGGKAKISAPTGPAGNQVQITLQWVDSRAQSGAGETKATSGFGTDTFVLATEF